VRQAGRGAHSLAFRLGGVEAHLRRGYITPYTQLTGR
jgi:hypothetical protein